MTETPTPETLPNPATLIADFQRLLTVEPLGDDRFLGRRKPGGVGRVFGGQVIAQALGAAELTVANDRAPHSLHAYFLRGGSEDYEVEYRIERDFDGGSFCNRRVIASQQGVPILNLTASFHRREDGVEHQDAMPDVPPPDGLRNEAELMRLNIDRIPEAMRAVALRPRPIEVRPVNPETWRAGVRTKPSSAIWFRAVATLPDDPRFHHSALAFATDYALLGTCTLPHGVSWLTGEIQGASLDHAVWFHSDFRVDEWLLYATDSPWAGRGRGFNRGRIFSADGRLVAETAQEGLIRRVNPKS